MRKSNGTLPSDASYARLTFEASRSSRALHQSRNFGCHPPLAFVPSGLIGAFRAHLCRRLKRSRLSFVEGP